LIEKYYSFHRFFTPQRLRYPWFIGGALWAGWLLSIILGKGNVDLSGHLIGTDFIAFYTAGKIILSGRAADLYDLQLARDIQLGVYGQPTDNFNPYLNPPHYALAMTPFALLPYPWAPILWMSVGLVLLWVSLRWLNGKHKMKTFFLSLSWLPVFYAVSFGQNTFLSLAILSLTYFLWSKEKRIQAGLALSLLLFRPQFILGVGLLWLLEWRKNWRSLVGLVVGSGMQILLSLWLFPEASLDYIHYVLKINANLMQIEGFPLWNAYSIQAFWISLLPGQKLLEAILYWTYAMASILAFLRFWRKNRLRNPLMFTASLCLMVYVIPYIMVYDWALLLIPAVLLWNHYPQLRKYLAVNYAIIWIVSFFSNSLTYLQLRAISHAIQISIPIFTMVLMLLYKLPYNEPVDEKSLPIS